MSDFLFVAEKIHDQTAFIKILRESTELSISEIRDCLTHKKPFFDTSDYDDDEGEVGEFIQMILHYAKSHGDTIKIFEKGDEDSQEMSREISEEIYNNIVNRGRSSSKYLDELDEE